jgi:hypothetical protein
MPTPTPTIDELVATAKRTSLPTLFVEGSSDAALYRLLEDRFNLPPGTVLHCGGREAVLSLFERRHEFSGTRCAFLADRDLWAFSAIPSKYTGVVFTSGFSIENDLLAGEGIERLLSSTERDEFRSLIDLLASWLSFEVQEWLSGREARIGIHVNELIEPGANELSLRWRQQRGFVEPDEQRTSTIRSGYRLLLRGKTLLQALCRVLSHPERPSKYSKENILEIAATAPNHEHRDGLIERISIALFGTQDTVVIV